MMTQQLGLVLVLLLTFCGRLPSSSVPQMKKTGDDANPCCKEVALADCWGFTAGEDSTASIQAAIDCPLAHTVVVRNMSSPWIVAPHHEATHLNVTELDTVRTAINFSTSNQLVIFQPGVIVLAKRFAFHGMNDNFAFVGSNFAPVRNVTILGKGALWKMWKHDYQCTACPTCSNKTSGQPVACPLPCDPCPACNTKSKLYNETKCCELRPPLLHLWSACGRTPETPRLLPGRVLPDSLLILPQTPSQSSGTA
jgi:hypothetical protein